MGEKRFRLDFAIALGALLISTIAAISTVYQTRVIAQQFSATVWPYVTFDRTNSPSMMELDLRNDGLGPAIVHGVTIDLDGKHVSSLEAALTDVFKAQPQATKRIRAAAAHGNGGLSITTSTPHAGMVVPANAKHVLVRLNGAVLVSGLGPSLLNLKVSLCYCSLTGSCWRQTLAEDQTPVAVASCPRDGT